MMSSTKPEVHNVVQCHQKRTQKRPQTTNHMHKKFGEVQLCMQADRQTEKETHSSQYFAPLPGAK